MVDPVYGSSTAQRLYIIIYHIPNVACAKEVCNRGATYQLSEARKSGEKVREHNGLH